MYRVCVDIGGTFTDCVVSDETGKPSSIQGRGAPKDGRFEQGVLDAMAEAAEGYGLTPAEFYEPR